MAKNSYNKLINKINSLTNDGELEELKIEEYKNKFKEVLSNDLNTSSAITILFDVLKSELNDNTKKYLINDFDKVLSLNLNSENNKELDEKTQKYILSKIEERNKAKLNKDYTKADEIRNQLLDMNIELIDTRNGTQYKIID